MMTPVFEQLILREVKCGPPLSLRMTLDLLEIHLEFTQPVRMKRLCLQRAGPRSIIYDEKGSGLTLQLRNAPHCEDMCTVL